MNEKKNIDKLFKEQLKNFEVAPNDAVWEKIHEELHEDKRKKRRVVVIWWQAAGVAAVLALLFAVGSQVFNSSENITPENTIVKDINTDSDSNTNSNEVNTNQNDLNKELILEENEGSQIANTNDSNTEKSDGNQESNINLNKSQLITEIENSVASEANNNQNNPNNSETSGSVSNANKKERLNSSNLPTDNKNNLKDAVANSKQSKESIEKDPSESPLKNKSELKNASELKKLIESTTESTNTSVTDSNAKTSSETNSEGTEASSNLEETDPTKTIEEETKENAIENAIAAVEETNEKEKEEEKQNRWSVSPIVAPVYFSSLGEGSSIDDQFIGNSKESEINMSYGVSGSYAVNKKLKIRAGINRVDLGYSTNDVLIFENGNSDALARSNNQMKNVDLSENVGRYSIYSADSFNFNNAPTTIFTQEQGSLNQQLGFIEVPIEIEYSLVEKKLGVNLIGGFSTLFLNQNDIYAVFNSGERERIGDASNVRDLSYSANFGIGFDYNFSNQWQLNLEPTFKYQINTFNNTSGDFQPFFIGVYTGLSFKF